MPLSVALPMLEMDIFMALENARGQIAVAAESGKTPTEINQLFAFDLSLAIHSYTTQALVQTNVITVLAGIAAPLAPAGACPVAGAGMGTGTGVLL